MKKIEFSQTITLLANIGVIGGILLLAYELRQNNELMTAEARQIRTNMVIEAWRSIAESGDLAELRTREKNGEELGDAEIRRVDASVMAVYVMLDWTFRELSADSTEMNQVRVIQRNNFANHPEYRRVWNARKDSFHPAFVQWMDENVASQ
jgi:hypothetical protein